MEKADSENTLSPERLGQIAVGLMKYLLKQEILRAWRVPMTGAQFRFVMMANKKNIGHTYYVDEVSLDGNGTKFTAEEIERAFKILKKNDHDVEKTRVVD